MPLEKTTASVNLLGLDTKSPVGISVPGKLNTLENVQVKYFNDLGIEISKRWGYQSLTTATTAGSITSPRTVTTRNDELLMTTQSTLWSYSPGGLAWSNRGGLVNFGVSATQISGSTLAQTCADCVYLNGLQYVCFEMGGTDSYFSVYDASNGAAIATDVKVGSSLIRPHLCVIGQTVALIACNSSGAAGFAYSISPKGVLSGPFSMGGFNPFGASYDMKYHSTLGVAVVAWVNSSTFTGYTGTLDSSLNFTFGADTLISLTGGATCTAILDSDWSDGYIYVGWSSQATGVFVAQLNSNLTLAVTETFTSGANSATQLTGYSNNVTNHTILFAEQTVALSYNTSIIRYDFTRGPNTVNSTQHRSVGIASKAFKAPDGNYYFLATYGSSNQGAYFMLADGTTVPMAVVAKHSNGDGGGILARVGNPASVAMVSSGVFLIPTTRRKQLYYNAATGTVYTTTGVQLATFTYDDQGLGSGRVLGKETHLPGGQLRSYDGSAAYEHGFHLSPELALFGQGAGGALTLLSTYAYVGVYEWVDDAGQLHQSAPSIPLNITLTGSNQTISVSFSCYRITRRPNVSLVLYRTKANGSFYYRISSISVPKLNDATVDQFTTTDAASDASINGNLPLYTNGNVLSNDSPPSCRLVEVYKNRMFLAGCEDQTAIWYSKDASPGYGVAFSAGQIIKIDNEDGPITALASDGVFLYAFKRNSLYVVQGDGADALGNGGFLPPTKLPANVGAVDSRSIARTPEGVIFRSAKGFYLITQGQAPEYIGSPVEDFSAQVTVGVAVDPSTSTVRWFTSGGICIVYSWEVKKWWTHTGMPNAISACAVAGVPHWLDSSGVVHKEVSGSYVDDGNPIVTRVVFDDIGVSAVQGYARIYELQLLGKFNGAHCLQVTLGFDYSQMAQEVFYVDTATGTNPYGADSPYGTGNYGSPGQDGVWRFAIKPKIQKVSAISVEVKDVFPGGLATGGFALSNLSILLGVKPGLGKLTPGRRAAPV